MTEDDDRVIVVGSGPCGATAATRLVERGLRVTMLDAGTHPPRGLVAKAAGNTVFRAVSRRELSDERLDGSSTSGVTWTSSLSLGGLSNYWTAAVPRFAPGDFTDGARLDERYRWPVTYDELVPHYERVESFLEITAGANSILGLPDNVRRHTRGVSDDWGEFAARADHCGHGVGLMPMAKGRPWMIARRGTEFCSYHCLVTKLMGDRRFELVTGAFVRRLRCRPGTTLVDVVEYVDVQSGQPRTIRGRAVVVAAGTIDSTVLLLRSTSPDFPTGLGNSRGVVGRYLHDHPKEWWIGRATTPMRALVHPIYIARAPFEGTNPLMATSLTLGLSARAARLKTYVRGSTSSFGVQVFGTMVPRPDVGVSLPSGPDRFDVQPQITLRYDDATVSNLLEGRDRLREVFAAAGREIDVPGPFHDLVPGSSYHYGGTVRMHDSPEFGVLDGWNRVHDAPNVLVVDSSTFTTGPEKNPTLTAMALADRAAQHLADELGG